MIVAFVPNALKRVFFIQTPKPKSRLCLVPRKIDNNIKKKQHRNHIAKNFKPTHFVLHFKKWLKTLILTDNLINDKWFEPLKIAIKSRICYIKPNLSKTAYNEKSAYQFPLITYQQFMAWAGFWFGY